MKMSSSPPLPTPTTGRLKGGSMLLAVVPSRVRTKECNDAQTFPQEEA